MGQTLNQGLDKLDDNQVKAFQVMNVVDGLANYIKSQATLLFDPELVSPHITIISSGSILYAIPDTKAGDFVKEMLRSILDAKRFNVVVTGEPIAPSTN